MSEEQTVCTRFATPIGSLEVAATERGITNLELPGAGRKHRHRDPAGWRPESKRVAENHLDAARAALVEYFAGGRKDFGDLLLAPSGTPFQLSVWRALLEIPFGATESYGGLATRIGRPGAARAVGLANNRNPIAIIIPCHRVIGADGQLTGYGGGLPRKRWLLTHEGAIGGELFALPSAG